MPLLRLLHFSFALWVWFDYSRDQETKTMKIDLADYTINVRILRILGLLIGIYLLVSGKLQPYARVVQIRDAQTALITLCLILIAITLSMRILLRNRTGGYQEILGDQESPKRSKH